MKMSRGAASLEFAIFAPLFAFIIACMVHFFELGADASASKAQAANYVNNETRGFVCLEDIADSSQKGFSSGAYIHNDQRITFVVSPICSEEDK